MAQNSSSILDDLRSHLSGDAVNDISRRIGADPEKTKAAIDGAIPMLLAALGKEAADPSRRAGLHQAIQEDHDGSILDNLQGYLSGGTASIPPSPRAIPGDSRHSALGATPVLPAPSPRSAPAPRAPPRSPDAAR